VLSLVIWLWAVGLAVAVRTLMVVATVVVGPVGIAVMFPGKILVVALLLNRYLLWSLVVIR
jgi:hypothetical protein